MADRVVRCIDVLIETLVGVLVDVGVAVVVYVVEVVVADAGCVVVVFALVAADLVEGVVHAARNGPASHTHRVTQRVWRQPQPQSQFGMNSGVGQTAMLSTHRTFNKPRVMGNTPRDLCSRFSNELKHQSMFALDLQSALVMQEPVKLHVCFSNTSNNRWHYGGSELPSHIIRKGGKTHIDIRRDIVGENNLHVLRCVGVPLRHHKVELAHEEISCMRVSWRAALHQQNVCLTLSICGPECGVLKSVMKYGASRFKTELRMASSRLTW